MIRSVPLSEHVRKAFEPTPRGVVGLVEELLELGRENGLRVEYRAGRCHITTTGADADEPIDLPISQSVFRAVLARVAALCNERVPDFVTPYRGEADLTIPSDPTAVLRVSFANTAAEQWLEVAPGTSHAAGGNGTFGGRP